MEDILKIKDKVISNMEVIPDMSFLTFSGKGGDLRETQHILNELAANDVSIDMAVKQIYQEGNWSFSCSFSAARLQAVIESGLLDYAKEKEIKVHIIDSAVQITLIGVGMATASGVLSKVFGLMKKEKIDYYSITTSEISISILIPTKDKMRTVVLLSSEFEL